MTSSRISLPLPVRERLPQRPRDLASAQGAFGSDPSTGIPGSSLGQQRRVSSGRWPRQRGVGLVLRGAYAAGPFPSIDCQSLVLSRSPGPSLADGGASLVACVASHDAEVDRELVRCQPSLVLPLGLASANSVRSREMHANAALTRCCRYSGSRCHGQLEP